MCILFSYVSKLKKPGEFKLILINNRDEFFHRPCNVACFRSENNIYAADQTPGKEGGTWLGLSKLGRIGVLLNLSSKEYARSDSNLGRGNLVPDFLNHTEGIVDYVKKLSVNSSLYNPFNLVLYEKNKDQLWNTAVYNNHNSEFKPIDTSFLALSNHLYHEPYLKTAKGKGDFESIVERYNNTEARSVLVDNLLSLLKQGPIVNPDANNAYDDEATDVTDRIFVDYPNYGTRTHTIILVDDKDKVYYNEHTLSFPVNRVNPQWTSQFHEFELN